MLNPPNSGVPTPDPLSKEGAEVEDSDTLYRCLLYAAWYMPSEGRVTSAAFREPIFSVDVASIAGSPENTLARFLPGTGIALMPCRPVKQVAQKVIFEPDDRYPENKAHAHVYHDGRKATMRKLAELCSKPICKIPEFDS